MERTIDRRTARTRKNLGDALVALILRKDYEAISVQEIIDEANVGRFSAMVTEEAPAHAVGTVYKGVPAGGAPRPGAPGNIAIFSFHPIKNITTASICPPRPRPRPGPSFCDDSR
mgnify:CR=1 FL=1